MVMTGQHLISSDVSRRSEQEQLILDRIYKWEAILKEFKDTSSEYNASVEAFKEWSTLPPN